MNKERHAALLMLIERLKSDIDTASRYSLDLTAKLLKMALLDANMQVHSISDEELRALSNSLDVDMHAEPAEATKH